MSRRCPLSEASRAWDLLARTYPTLAEEVAGEPELSQADRRAVDLAGHLCRISSPSGGADMTELAALAFGAAWFCAPEDLVFFARWRACRQVYRVHHEVAVEIGRQDPDDTLPVEALSRLPYPIVYVRSPIEVSAPEPRTAAGFLAWVDREPEVGSRVLVICYLLADLRRVRVHVPLEEDATIARLVEETTEDDARAAAEIGGLRATDEAGSRERFARALGTALNLLVYVARCEADAPVSYAPPRPGPGTRVGRRTNPETVREAGAIIGARIGEARRTWDRRRGPEEGRRMAPHVRRAHWQHYWVGRRKGRTDGRYGDELVVRWLPPVFVAGDGGAIEVVHDSGGAA